jgi:2,4-diketo-3-deoxy-L-fuconate hydrolase
VPEQPDIFARWRSTLAVDGQAVPIPPRDDNFDWEGELAVVIGKELRDVTPEAAQAGFLGYACFNDLSARKFQMASDRWTLGKNTDSSGPLGPWIVTADEIPTPINCEYRPALTATLSKTATRQISSSQAPKSPRTRRAR